MTKKKTGRKTTKRDVFEDPQKLKGRILSLMRADFKKSPMYSEAKARSFEGKAVYKCPNCGTRIYTGVSDKNYEKMLLEDPKLQRGEESKMLNLDHIESIVPYNRSTKEMTLDELAPRVYCNENNMQYICRECHSEKTSIEATLRKEARAKKKKDKK